MLNMVMRKIEPSSSKIKKIYLKRRFKKPKTKFYSNNTPITSKHRKYKTNKDYSKQPTCYKCRRVGHFSNQCKTKEKKINNLEISEKK